MTRSPASIPPPAGVDGALAEIEHKQAELDRRHPLWPAKATVAVAIVLGLALPDAMAIGAPWMVPACEAVLLAGLLITSERRPTREDRRRRRARIALVSVVSGVNVVALFLLTQQLLEGGRPADGRSLLVGGAVLWITAVLLFAIWFWELDRGGPVRRLVGEAREPDFLFPQMTEDVDAPEDWRPGLGDYLYLSLNNAASFSPAETVPLSGVAKLLMSIQTIASLATMTLVLSYAVNNLG